MKPDGIDLKILEALMADGRASLRHIAQRTSLTTPTVSARMARMTKAGLIKGFVPIISADSVQHGILALLTLNVESASAEKLAKNLAKLGEVQHVYMTTGQSITLKVALDEVEGLQSFLKRNLSARTDVKITSSQIITRVVKEELPSLRPGVLTLNLKCDYCHEEVTRARPYTVAAWPSRYYFCCNTCRKAYLEKYGSRLVKLDRK